MTSERWDMLFTDARLATMASGPGLGIIDDGAIAVADDKIAWIGRVNELPLGSRRSARWAASAEGRWITPGLIDCHNHLVYAGNRSLDFEMRLAGATRAEIAEAGGGIHQTVRLTKAASEDELAQQAGRRLSRLIAEGVTTVEAKSGYGLDLQNELKLLRVARLLQQRLPVSIVSTFGIYAVDPAFDGSADDYVNFLCSTTLPVIAGEQLATAVDVQLDEAGFSKEQAGRIFAVANQLGLRIKVHTDELSDFGGSAFAAKHGALSSDHLDFVSEDGVKAMRNAGTVAVLLPGNTHTFRSARLPPVELFRRYGVPMAIGTNSNPGPSPTTSMLLMLNMACTLFGLTVDEALLGATRHAATALGVAGSHGSLEPGKAADFVLWDIERPAELAYHLGLIPCAQVVHQGVPIMPHAQLAPGG